jgi:hypothetical protein
VQTFRLADAPTTPAHSPVQVHPTLALSCEARLDEEDPSNNFLQVEGPRFVSFNASLGGAHFKKPLSLHVP